MRLGVHLGRVGRVVLVDDRGVVASGEAVARGCLPEALRAALSALPALSRFPVESVTVATSWLADAVRDPAELSRVAVLRLAHSDRSVFPPLTGWPEPLRAAVHGWVSVQPGGCDLTGRPLGEPALDEVLRFVHLAAREGAQTLAVTAVGSPMLAEQETWIADAVRREVPELHVTLSHELGGLGLLARENTAVLNAALRPAAERIADDCQRVVAAFLPGVPVLFSRHDAALMNNEYLRRFPVSAAQADVAAAFRGAGLLAGVDDAVVLEWDGERGRAGLVEAGFPRRGSTSGGPRLSLPVPEQTPLRRPDVPGVLDRMRADEPRPVVVVGLVPDGLEVAVQHPPHSEFAAAVGAAAAQPAAEVDRVLVEPHGGDLAAAVDRVAEEALVRAISAGARPDSVRIAEVRTTPVAYLPGSVFRVQVRATGMVQH